MSAAEWVFSCGASVSRALHSLVGASGFLGFLLLAAMADCPSVVPEFFRRRRRRVFGLLSGVEPSEEIAFAHSMLGLGRASLGRLRLLCT